MFWGVELEAGVAAFGPTVDDPHPAEESVATMHKPAAMPRFMDRRLDQVERDCQASSAITRLEVVAVRH